MGVIVITYDYLLKRKVGNQVREFTPIEALRNIPDIAYIKGPNSSGKSTLLNILALGFYGLELSDIEIPIQLKNRMQSLLEVDHQQLTFTIQVENEKTGDRFLIEKNNQFNREIILSKLLNGERKPISPDIFKRDFRLLYDIPNDPLERLPGLLNEVRSTQLRVANRITEFRVYLENLLKEIKESKDPEQIDNLEAEIASVTENIATINNSINTMESDCKAISMYFSMRKWITLDETVNTLQSRFTQISSQIKDLGAGSKLVAKDYSKKQSKLRSNLQESKELISKIRHFLTAVVDTADQQRFLLWKNADPEEEIYHPEFHNQIRVDSRYFESVLRKRYEKKKDKLSSVIEKVKLYKILLQALDEYRFNETLIPGLNQPVKNFVSLLQEESKKYSTELDELSNYEKYANELNSLIKLIEDSIALAKEYQGSQKEIRETSINVVELKREQENLQLALYQNKKALDDAQSILRPLSLNEVKEHYEVLCTSPIIQLYRALNDGQINEKLDWLSQTIAEEKTKLNGKERLLIHAETELERLQKKEPHPLFSNLSILENRLQKIRFVEKQFKVNFEEYIKRAIEARKPISRIELSEQRYQNELGKLLGIKIGNIRHITELYKVNRIDVFEKMIFTTSGVEIKFADLGTGQGQAAYLEALLGMQSDKKVIALFDEVAMMDENSLQPIKDKLKAMYDAGKLLAAIIVQKDEIISIESII